MRVARPEQMHHTTASRSSAVTSGFTMFRIVMKTGWAPFDGKITGNDALARACAEKLHVPKAG